MSNAHSQEAFHLMYRDENELSVHHVDVPGISGTMRFRRSNKLKMNLKIGLLLYTCINVPRPSGTMRMLPTAAMKITTMAWDLCLP